jgi:hypothetical protein
MGELSCLLGLEEKWRDKLQIFAMTGSSYDDMGFDSADTMRTIAWMRYTDTTMSSSSGSLARDR